MDVYGSLPLSSLAVEVIPANRNKLTFEFAATVDALAFRLFDSESPLSLSATDASGAEVPLRKDHGVHFHEVGADLLARQLEDRLVEDGWVVDGWVEPGS